MTDILKRKDFARWQSGEKLPDAALCKAVQEMESGLIDADLGGSLYKKRVARPGGGKSGGYRTLVSARIGSRYVFRIRPANPSTPNEQLQAPSCPRKPSCTPCLKRFPIRAPVSPARAGSTARNSRLN